MNRCILAAILAAPCALLMAWHGPDSKETGPLVGLAGSFSEVKKYRIEVIGDEPRWQQVWKEHMGDKLEKSANAFDVIPQMDFTRCMIVAMFSGESMNGSGWFVVSEQEKDGHTLIRYDHTGFQTASFDGTGGGVPTTAYGFAVLPRSSLPMILEENTQGLIGGKPEWTEKQRLPALPKPAAAPGPKPVR